MVLWLLFPILLVTGTSGFAPRGSAWVGKNGARARLQVFLDECQLRESAWDWAKEVSRTNRPRPSVVALFDEDLACVHVGAHHDAALAVGHMVRKHGIKTVAALKEETFPPDVAEEPVGLQMMASLVQSWLAETSQRGNTPVGNVAEGWADFDPSQSPFVIGAFGEAGEDPDAPKPESEMTEEELVDMRRQNLYEAMNEAMKAGDETKAQGLMNRLTKLGGGMKGLVGLNAGTDDSMDSISA